MVDSLNVANLPPVISGLKEQLEDFILAIDSLPIHDKVNSRKYWPVYPEPEKLFSPTLSPLTTTLEVVRDSATGEITGVEEIHNANFCSTAKNSFSLQRVPGPPEEAVRGSSTNYPFWPGGVPEPILPKLVSADDDLFNPDNYLTKHPKLSQGLQVSKPKTKKTVPTKQVEPVVNLSDMLKIDDSMLEIFVKHESIKPNVNISMKEPSEEERRLVENLALPGAMQPAVKKVIKISNTPKSEVVSKGTEWAIVIDVNLPVDDFHIKVANPACTYPFELDTFQKQAIIHLEKHDSVFVAAHTSAGKTVIAEYAIAIALKNMTRAIYTSPIKALSNQKYRDLKAKFDDVGLITGDIQINPKASCLIMTTEILQSMLYNGSDLIRDLEWVIFDEVHYINNVDRGHVWEEVIIMLPAHVNIVLLSATVPNTVEFADWIGRIKKKSIYVISTSKRPVPLEHYLYASSVNKSKDEKFMVVDSHGNFMMKGYNDAIDALKEKEKKFKKTQGPKLSANAQMLSNDKNTYICLLQHLGKNKLLPTVAFTLSKKRCDENALQLMSQDLTSNAEKREIQIFIKNSTNRLQDVDKKLPQVVHMKELLKLGIGVHHSGILPILKEVVEMLFAKGLVKLLFATETFAMGVNMPARSVVFDSIRKHDGTAFRDIVPSEYIQMAGRAGRRGLDTTGTVIILCKAIVPELSSLKTMMLGKPTHLESKFKLTYSMILNLLRAEAFRVEDMMKRSFSELLLMRNQSKYEDELKEKEEKIEKYNLILDSCSDCKGIDTFYAMSRDYFDARRDYWKKFFQYHDVSKYLKPGRMVKICHESYQNYLACLLTKAVHSDKTATVLILKDRNIEAMSQDEAKMRACLYAADDRVISTEDTSEHKIMEVNIWEIQGITKKSVSIDGAKIIENVKKREIPRFQDDPPGQSVVHVLRELQTLNEKAGSNLAFLDLKTELKIKDLDTVIDLQTLLELKAKVRKQPCLKCPLFAEHFANTFMRLNMMEEVARLKYLMSEEALELHPEYQSRMEVLKSLGYIEDNKTVTLKGRVACEMGNCELMMTELLLENVFANRTIEEMTAILSSLVFQNRKKSPLNLTSSLKEGVLQFKQVAGRIGITQQNCGLPQLAADFVEEFDFGLAEVVHEWARGAEFAKLMELTEVQEGVVVKVIQRLDETLRDVRTAARVVGDPALHDRAEEASAAIRRDIVFTASLYTQ